MPVRTLRPRSLSLAIHAAAMTLALAGAAPALLAAEAPAASSARSYDIAPGPLGRTLSAFASDNGVSLAFDPALTEGRRSAALRGRYAPVEALHRLLLGSGLELQQRSDGSYTLVPAATDGALELQSSLITAQAAGAETLPAEYAGGQVARGARLGMLGNADVMDAPFSITSYTARTIEQQQARSVADLLQANDPSVRVVGGRGDLVDSYTIRGFSVQNADVAFNGLYGLLPFWRVPIEFAERVEVLKGPNALLGGISPGGSVGGTINLVPKRATSEPITQASALYLSDAQFGGTVDVGRRFGPDQSVGLRANATYTSGDTAVNNQTAERLALTLGFDFRSDATRIDGDIGFLRRDVGAFQGSIFLAAGVQLPAPPYANRSSYQPWERLQADDLYGALRFEHDITPWLTGFIKVGAKRANISTLFLNQSIGSYSGNTTTLSAGQFLQNTEVLSAETGLRGVFNTGPIRHEAALVGDYMKTQIWSQNNPLTIPTSSNIYNPTFIPAPSLFGLRNNAPLASDSILSSIGLVDALSAAEDRVQLIVGARAQRLQNANYSAVTGLPTNGNDKSVVSPSASLVVKPTKELMFYGNYIQALQPGPVAGPGTTNAGQSFSPFLTTQFELGAKVDFGTLGATLSAFQLTIPSAFTDLSTNTFVVDGQQRNRGLEFVAFGEPLPGLKLLGGFTLLEAIQTTTAGGLNNGKVAVGTAPFQFSFGADWDTPFAKGFGVMGRVVYNGQVYLNPANTQAAPPWTRFDAGLRYSFDGPEGKPLTVRANVINLFDANYWVATTAFFAQNQPRTFLLSLTADF